MKRRFFALLLSAAVLLSLASCGLVSTRDRGDKSFTLTVNHGDGTQFTAQLTSDKDTLGEALEEKGFIAGELGPYGLYVKTVDKETVDEAREQWWCLTKGGQSVNTGVDSTPLENGDVFEFTLKEGY